jgi:hypothetical protein
VGEDKRPTLICGARVSEWEVGGGGAWGWEWEVDGGPKRARKNAPRSFEEREGGWEVDRVPHALLRSAGVDGRWMEGPAGKDEHSFEERGGGNGRWMGAGSNEGPTLCWGAWGW